MPDKDFVDLYETLQISASAEPETVQRVYRMLAHRYHPDNRETGNEDKFRAVHEAYRVLSDSVQRAQYDVEYHSRRTLRWKVFDQQMAAEGFESEKSLRHGILSLLYAKRRADPGNPGVSLLEMESLLGRPREHLEFSMWFLKEKELIGRTEDSGFMITVGGVEYVEDAGLGARMQKLLERGGGATE
ncbi:MAG: DnaJ domain-containing protein [Acidobacteria bacterium]|nr:DnaJ domain-containing protein [Acidobacteriota bacterium]